MTEPGCTPQDVLDFWLADGWAGDWPGTDLGPRWFGGGAELDNTIRERFGALVEAALDGGVFDWERHPEGRVALVIALDQFTRNVHRGSARAFAGDGRAQKIVLQAMALDIDRSLPRCARVFLYLPLMHAESLMLQDESVIKFTELHQHAPAELQPQLAGFVRYAEEHRDIVRRFGRFPHRNAALGRPSTEAEAEFLKTGPRYGQ